MLVPARSSGPKVRNTQLHDLCEYLSELTSAARILGCTPPPPPNTAERGEVGGSASSMEDRRRKAVPDAVRSCWQLAEMVEEVHSTTHAASLHNGSLRITSTPAPLLSLQHGGYTSIWVGYSPYAENLPISAISNTLHQLLLIQSSGGGTSSYDEQPSIYTSNVAMDGLMLEVVVVVGSRDVANNYSGDDPHTSGGGTLQEAVAASRRGRDERILYRLQLLAKKVERTRQMLLHAAFGALLGASQILELIEVGSEERAALTNPLMGMAPSTPSIPTHSNPSSPILSAPDYVLTTTATNSPTSTPLSPLTNTQSSSIVKRDADYDDDEEDIVLCISDYIQRSANMSPTESICSLLRHTTLVLEHTGSDDAATSSSSSSSPPRSPLVGKKRDRVVVRPTPSRYRCRVDVVPRLGEDTCTHSRPCLGNMELLFVVGEHRPEDSPTGPLLPGAPVRLWCRLCIDQCTEPRAGMNNGGDEDHDDDDDYASSHSGHQLVVWNGIDTTHTDGYGGMTQLSLVPLSEVDATDVALFGSTYDPLPSSPHIRPPPTSSSGYLSNVAAALEHSIGSAYLGGKLSSTTTTTKYHQLPVERLQRDAWSQGVGGDNTLCDEDDDEVLQGLLQRHVSFMGVDVGWAYPHLVPLSDDAASTALLARINRWFVMPLHLDIFVLPPDFTTPPPSGTSGSVGLTLFSRPLGSDTGCDSDDDVQRRGAAKLLQRILRCIEATPPLRTTTVVDGSSPSAPASYTPPPIGISLSINRGASSEDSTFLMLMSLTPLGGIVGSQQHEGGMSLRVAATPLPIGRLAASSPSPHPYLMVQPCFAPLHGIAAFIDLDRTLIDNSPMLIESLPPTAIHTADIQYTVYIRGEAVERSETVVLRPGVAALLRRLVVSGLLLILVTKSKRSRVRAVLRALVDPHGHLFGPLAPHDYDPLSPRVMCSEDIAISARSHTSNNIRKSISRVVTYFHTTYDRFTNTIGVTQPLERPLLRRCYILDDTPADWVVEDLPHLLHIWPFTLGGGWSGDVVVEAGEWDSGRYAYAAANAVCKLVLKGLHMGGGGGVPSGVPPSQHIMGPLPPCSPSHTHTQPSSSTHQPPTRSAEEYGKDFVFDGGDEGVSFTVPAIFKEYTNMATADTTTTTTTSDNVPTLYHATSQPVVEEGGSSSGGSGGWSSYATPERSRWDDGDVEEVVPL